ncbi:acyloxyacyl hydrolase, partial [Escherichia coli]|nr:acyloxyacyl hydrolase [Escherichia coli]
MKKLYAFAAATALTFGTMGAAQAADVTAAIGQSGDSTMVYRVGAQWDWNHSWLESSYGRLTGYWDLGYTYWDGDETASNHSLSFSPVFVYEFAGQNVRPYIE